MRDLLAKQKAYFSAHRYPDAATRRTRLRDLRAAIMEHTDLVVEALRRDLGKSPVEAYTAEIGFVLRDIDHAERRVSSWMRPRRVRVPWMTRPAQARFRPEPRGVALILAPWNYPFQLLFSPLAAALAAGNGACLKPSQWAPATAQVAAAICRAAFPTDLVTVVTGDDAIAAELAALPFDHIFFTGSAATGRRVAAAAAVHLAPVTLELGGKSPCLVCPDAPLEIAARRILWGKSLNAGQTCVAPDYALVHEDVFDAFLDHGRRATASLAATLPDSDYPRIVNRHHFDRLCKLLGDGTLRCGGETNAQALKIRPALLTNLLPNSALMQDEIFGPLLPVLPWRDWDDAVRRILDHPSPLAAYLFTRDRRTMRRFQDAIPAGGICVNDTISHIMPAELPFGGRGQSGYGRYRGRAGFDEFSHTKAMLTRPFRPEPRFRYPPYRTNLGLLRRAYSWLAR